MRASIARELGGVQRGPWLPSVCLFWQSVPAACARAGFPDFCARPKKETQTQKERGAVSETEDGSSAI